MGKQLKDLLNPPKACVSTPPIKATETLDDDSGCKVRPDSFRLTRKTSLTEGKHDGDGMLTPTGNAAAAANDGIAKVDEPAAKAVAKRASGEAAAAQPPPKRTCVQANRDNMERVRAAKGAKAVVKEPATKITIAGKADANADADADAGKADAGKADADADADAAGKDHASRAVVPFFMSETLRQSIDNATRPSQVDLKARKMIYRSIDRREKYMKPAVLVRWTNDRKNLTDKFFFLKEFVQDTTMGKMTVSEEHIRKSTDTESTKHYWTTRFDLYAAKNVFRADGSENEQAKAYCDTLLNEKGIKTQPHPHHKKNKDITITHK